MDWTQKVNTWLTWLRINPDNHHTCGVQLMNSSALARLRSWADTGSCQGYKKTRNESKRRGQTGEEGITRVNNPDSFACTCSIPSVLTHHGPLCQHMLLHASRSRREIIHCFLVSFLLGNNEYISPLVWKCTEASFSTIWIDSHSTFLYIIHTAAFRRPSPHVPSLDGDPDSLCRFLLGKKG